MTKILGYKVTILLLIVFMLTSALACGGGGSSTPTSDINPESTSSATSGNLESAQAQQISFISQATTEEERKPAIEEVVRQGFTLGLVDENGNQLNHNVPADALSLTPEDVVAHAAMIPGSNYRTVNYVVDSLAEEGITLASTEEVITLEDFLPDLQDYVDWSFDNPDDPKSGLGLLIGSGHELEVPDSAPTIEGETLISPLASLMMTADILLGIEETPSQESDDIVSSAFSFFADAAYADDTQESTSPIQGLITKIKPIMSGLIELAPSEKWKEWAKKLIAAMELGNRFTVRLLDKATLGDMTKTKNIELSRILLFNGREKSQEFVAALVLLRSEPEDTVNFVAIPTSFTLALISPVDKGGDDQKKLWATLFADADAEIKGSGDYLIDQDGHLLVYPKPLSHAYVLCTITATQLPPKVTRSALLLVSAKIEVPLDSLDPEIIMGLNFLGMRIETIENLIKTVQPTPWVCAVVLEKEEDVICEKKYHSDDKTVWWEGCTLNGQNHGKCRYYYEDGDIHSEGTYDNGEKDGFHTTYYSNPAGTVDCEAEYEDDELLWEKCYSVDGQILSEINADGSGKNYYWSGRIQTECNYTSSGAECRTYCDNEAHTLCGEYELDEYGDDVNVRDDCDTRCN